MTARCGISPGPTFFATTKYSSDFIRKRKQKRVLLCPKQYIVLLDFSLTVKAATLIFISGCGSATSSAKQGKSGSIYNLVKNSEVVWAAQMCVYFMKILTVYTMNSHLLTLIAHNHKIYVFVVH